MLFGSASIKALGKAKPQAGTLGYIWQLEGLTIGSICFTLIVVRLAPVHMCLFDDRVISFYG